MKYVAALTFKLLADDAEPEIDGGEVEIHAHTAGICVPGETTNVDAVIDAMKRDLADQMKNFHEKA